MPSAILVTKIVLYFPATPVILLTTQTTLHLTPTQNFNDLLPLID